MISKITVALLLLFVVFTNAIAQGDIKIAYVNMEKAMNSSVLAKKLTTEFQELFAKRGQKLKNLETELRNMREQAVKDRLTMSAKKKEELQMTLLKKDRELRFQKTILEEDAKLSNNGINRQVEQAVLKAVQEITKQENYDLVLIAGVLYSSQRIDITDKVIAKLQ